MKLDFSPVRRREMRLSEWAEANAITREDLVQFTNDMIDTMLAMLDGIDDRAVSFEPYDPDAEDTYAENPEDTYIGWTLGHVIAHVTASSEETCAQAATLARGVVPTGRNRYETPWAQVRTVADARQRLEESRRIRLAYLAAWPDRPHFGLTFTPYKSPQTCITRVLAGLFHCDSHLDQMREIIRQAEASGK